MNRAEEDALLALALTPGLGPTLTRRCLEHFGSAETVLGVSGARLAEVDGIGRGRADSIRRQLDAVCREGRVAAEREQIERLGVRLLHPDDNDYPHLLRHIPDPPPLLWMRGRLEPEDAVALAIVGSRRCTHYGREQADRFAAAAAQAGLAIVSGGAYGVDGAAHRAAMRVGGRTIAVLGAGLARPYPPRHAELFDQIASDGGDHGAVLSELPMTTPPMAENFPRRNRIISGLALGVLVVEAASRSGALITARLCVEEHGRELMALPGRVDSQASAGCHKMIREGWATLVTNLADVLDALGEAGTVLKARVSTTAGDGAGSGRDAESQTALAATLSDAQRRIAEAASEPRTLDEIAAWTELPVPQVRAELTMLEIRGTIRRQGGLFVRRTEAT